MERDGMTENEAKDLMAECREELESGNYNAMSEILGLEDAGNIRKFLGFLFLPDKGFYHPNSADIFLHHRIEFIVGLEHPVKNLEHRGN